MRPAARAQLQLVLYFLFAITSVSVAMGVGIPIMGRDYSTAIQLFTAASLVNGMINNPYQLLGLYLQIYLGTLGLMLFGNFIPSLVVLHLSQRLFLSIIAFLFFGFILAMALSMYYLIEPHKTFTDQVDVSSNDPNRSASGCFFFCGFSFLACVCAAIFQIHHSFYASKVNTTGIWSLAKTDFTITVHRDDLSVEQSFTNSPIKFRKNWGLANKIKAFIMFFSERGRRKALGFIGLCIFLG